MNRRLVAAVVATVALVPATAEAAARPKAPKKHVRTVTFDYHAGPVLNVEGVASGAVCSFNGVDTATCEQIALKADEYYVKITAADTTGQPVGLQWYAGVLPTLQDDGGAANAERFCTTKSTRLKKPKSIVVFVGPNAPSCPVQTTGKVTVTLSNLP